MESEGNKDSGNDSPTEQKGIFSSPELSVNSENLEEIKPELSEENKSRIASAFAQTDATQKHDQLSEQMAEQDAMSGTVIPADGIGNNSTTSTATGDIRIPGAKKKSKWLLVLAGLALLAVIGGAVAWLVLGRKDSSGGETIQELYANFMSYINNSPDGDYIYDASKASNGSTAGGPPQTDDPSEAESLEGQPEDQNEPDNIDDTPSLEPNADNSNDRSQRFILIADSWLGKDELNHYYDEVGKRYNKFIDKARNSENQAIKSISDANFNIFPAVFTIIKQSTIESGIAQYVYNEDIAGADKYINEILPAESSQELVNTMMSDFSADLRQTVSVYEIYNYGGCLSEDGVVWSCATDLGNSTAENANLKATEHLDDAMAIAEKYQMLAFSQLDALAKLVGSSNE